MSCVLYGDYLLWSLFQSDVDSFRSKYNLVLLPMMSSFDLTDRNCVNALNRKYKLTGKWFKGIGQLNFRRGGWCYMRISIICYSFDVCTTHRYN